mgnify:CR=1 FL=1
MKTKMETRDLDVFYGESDEATLVPLSAVYEHPLLAQTGVYVAAEPVPAAWDEDVEIIRGDVRIDQIRRIAAFFRDESCGQCVPCRVGTVRLEEALARNLTGGTPLEAELIDDIDRAMKDASICGLGHTAASAIQSAIRLGLLDR